jgi:hypothetical protein
MVVLPTLCLLRIPPSVPLAYFNQPSVLAATENYNVPITISDVNKKDGIKGNIVSCIGVVTIRWGLDWMIGFIDTLCTPLGNTRNYCATANLCILQFAAANTSVLSLLQSPLSVSWQRILTQEL